MQALIDKKDEVIRKTGSWTAHNIHLGHGLYTIAPQITGDEIKLRRIVQCVSDLSGGSVEGLRILDLACLEGLFAIELARQGANCLGIEGRELNIEKARFAKEALSLDNLELVQDDVRNLSVKKYGSFDVVLCLGLLYHLDVPDVFSFIESLSEVCRKICIVDTRIVFHPKVQYVYNGKTYCGSKSEEHSSTESAGAKMSKLWASLDNNEAFWLSRPSLYNALFHAGFTTAYECNIPAEPAKPADRITVVAIKGKPCNLLSAPLMVNRSLDAMPERPRRENSVAVEALRKVSFLFPRQLRKVGLKLTGRENKLT
jgi:SAM-dependent methyltransferase